MCYIFLDGTGVRVFKNTWFQRFARRERIPDSRLCETVGRALGGLIDADLGSGLIKQRVARTAAGKSGGYRTLLFFRAHDRAIFAFGFAKNDRGNVDDDDLEDLKRAAKLALGFSHPELDRLVLAGVLIEVDCDAEEERRIASK